MKRVREIFVDWVLIPVPVVLLAVLATWAYAGLVPAVLVFALCMAALFTYFIPTRITREEPA